MIKTIFDGFGWRGIDLVGRNDGEIDAASRRGGRTARCQPMDDLSVGGRWAASRYKTEQREFAHLSRVRDRLDTRNKTAAAGAPTSVKRP